MKQLFRIRKPSYRRLLQRELNWISYSMVLNSEKSELPTKIISNFKYDILFRKI